MKLAGLIRLGWRDTWSSGIRILLLGGGVALGVASLALILALRDGVETTVMRRFLGIVPNQLAVEPSSISLGVVQMSSGPVLDDATVERLRHLPGVKDALRRVRIALPANLRAEYAGKRLYSDILVEAIDPGLVSGEVPPDALRQRAPDQPLPVVLPAAMLDILNMGFSVNTGLPRLNQDLIIGHHFTLNLGSSSFKWGPTVSMRCEIVGISSRIGVGGPSLPISYLPYLDRQLRQSGGELPGTAASSVVLELNGPGDLPQVSEAVIAMGLTTPQQDRARAVRSTSRAIALGLSCFALLVLAVAGSGIANAMALTVKEEAGEIGLFRAVGASRRDILLLYLLRSAIVGLSGGLCGLLLAGVAAIAINHLAVRMMPGLTQAVAAVSVGHAFSALAFGLLASLLAGWFPARQAAHLEPAAVLRER